MTTKNIIAGVESALGSETLRAVDPFKKNELEGNFHIATKQEIDKAANSAYDAWRTYKLTNGHKKGEFLRKIAENIEALGDELVHRAMAESGLPEGRIKGERGRTCGQLRLFASLVEEGSWAKATIDEAIPDRKPMPRVDIRKIYQSLGPVAVFGASNFPLAFSTAGGDTASALASGCPVIVKGHPSHLGTHALVSQAITNAVSSCGLPSGTFSAITGGIPVGAALVKHPKIKAVGFTGSLGGGSAIMKASYERKEPIPVYAEMGSINPIFILADQLEGDLSNLATTLAGSINMGAGQFCTNPGVIVISESEHKSKFIKELQKAFAALAPSTMLNEGIHNNYNNQKQKIGQEESVQTIYNASSDDAWSAKPTLALTKATEFIKNDALHHEVFGPFSMIIECTSENEMIQVANSLQGQLSCTIMGSESSIKATSDLVDILREKAGRVLFNGVPTGVEVGYAMHHGGPYPSASSGMYTSVGTDAILRFVRPICFQNAPQTILPEELKDDNPLNIWRMVNGELSKSATNYAK